LAEGKNRGASREVEILVLRHQLMLNRKVPKRVRLQNIDRLILIWLYRIFPSIVDAVVVVKPETVIRWYRRGFQAYWHWKSRRHGGRPRINRRDPGSDSAHESREPVMGAPPIHGELLMLGIEVAESTVGRYNVLLEKKSGPGMSAGRFSQGGWIAETG
jgi:hypothetical protein